jgi:uncharacterized protein YkwD
MTLQYRLTALTIAIVWTVTGIGLFALPLNAQSGVANEILNRLNADRVAQGIPPLLWNANLAEAAQRHSDDMATNTMLSHEGADGSRFWERMSAAGYDLTAGAENVLLRPDASASGAYDQWWNSAPHRSNMLNPDYVEVGIAYSVAADGTHYFTMLLGNRAGISAPPLPATATPAPPGATPTVTPLPLTSTPLPPPTATRTLVPTDVIVATIIAPVPTNLPATVAPANANPIQTFATSTPRPQPTATPTQPPPDIRLLYDSQSLTLINVSGGVLNLTNLVFESRNSRLEAQRWNIEALSQPLSGFTDDDCLQVWGLDVSFLPKPAGCETRHAWVTVNEAGKFWQNANTFTVRNGSQRVGLCDVAAGVCDVNLSTSLDATLVDPVTRQSLPDLRFIYTPDSFTLVNVSGRRIDLRGIQFQSDSGSMSVSRWNTEFLTQPLFDFTPGDCLQVWGLAARTILSAPASCEVRHAWLSVGDDADFWRDDFTVIRDGVRIGRCLVTDTVCEVSLDADFGTIEMPDNTSSPAQNPATGAFDVRLTIDENGFTLLNTSGAALDLTGLAFESDGGVFPVSRWQTDALTRPLNNFSAGDCLQAWEVGGEYQAAPAACRLRHAWVAVGQDAQFWQNARTFRVRVGGNVLTTCETRSPVCEFNMP